MRAREVLARQQADARAPSWFTRTEVDERKLIDEFMRERAESERRRKARAKARAAKRARKRNRPR